MHFIDQIKSKFSSSSEEISELFQDDEVKEAAKSFLKLNRWSVFIFLFLTALSMVFYVGNVLAINDLYKDIRQLETRKKRILNTNNVLRSKVIELQSAKRIVTLAEEKLKMVKSNTPPVKLK